MYSNFNVKELEDLKDKSETIFTSIIDNLKAIRNECSNMSNIVISDDSNLGMRWQSLYESMEGPITNVEDTFVVVRALLGAYVENTIANEKAAQKELEELDNDMNTLAGKAETLLTGLTALRGVGFGATAVAIPALGSEKFISAPGQAVTKYAPPTVIDEPIAVTKYAPPTVIDEPIAVTKYAPPDAVTLYAPPDAVTKYAPPDVIIKYAPPSPDPVVPIVKYGPPDVIIKYAPPSPDPVVPIIKYAPPDVVPAYAPPSPGPDVPTNIPGVPYWMKPIDKK